MASFSAVGANSLFIAPLEFRLQLHLLSSQLAPHHDFAKLEFASSYVLHQHLKGCEAKLCGQRVERLLLHLLQLHSLSQLLHQLHPQTSLGEKSQTPRLIDVTVRSPVKHTVPLHMCPLTQSLCFSASSSAEGWSASSSSVVIFLNIYAKTNMKKFASAHVHELDL